MRLVCIQVDLQVFLSAVISFLKNRICSFCSDFDIADPFSGFKGYVPVYTVELAVKGIQIGFINMKQPAFFNCKIDNGIIYGIASVIICCERGYR